MRDRELEFFLLEFPKDRVTLVQRRTKWLFHVDMAPRLGGCDEHVMVLIDPARTDRHEIQLFFAQHFAIVGVGLSWIGPLTSRFASGLLCVRQRHNLDVGKFGKGDIDTMTIIPFPCGSNNPDSNTRLVRCA